MYIKKITSKNNPLVKQVDTLMRKSQARKKEQLFVVEGFREVRLALEGGYTLRKILFSPEILSHQMLQTLVQEFNFNGELIELGPDAYKRIAYRESTEGILAIAEMKSLKLSDLSLSENPLILVAQAIEKPGNIGAMLRTADAAALDAFILVDSITDIYNPNVIRSSVGGIFTNQLALTTTAELIEFVNKHNIRLYAATLQDSTVYYQEDYKSKPTAIAVGNEAKGLDTQIRKAAYKKIRIPMRGKLDSLNVSVSAAILISEACRQRSC